MHQTISLELATLKVEVVSPLCKVWVLVVEFPVYFLLDSYLAYQLGFVQEFMLGPISK